jgi:hypothetical protein
MALSRSRRRSGAVDYWPGFVDAMATLLLVIIFLLSIFMLAQFFLSQEITGRDTVLNRLNAANRRTHRIAGAGTRHRPGAAKPPGNADRKP